MRVLGLISDAFGGHGGIALYNRDIFTAISQHPSRPHVTLVPRVIRFPVMDLPENLEFVQSARNHKGKYVATVLGILSKRPHLDVIICGHISLLHLAVLAKWVTGAPLVLLTYGLEVWRRPRRPLTTLLLRSVDAIVSIRELTVDRFRSWAPIDGIPVHILENAIHLERYGIAPKNATLERQLRLIGKRVILTVGRVEEPYKGFDEMIEVMPLLKLEFPDLRYVVGGGGYDMSRLKEKARTLGVDNDVVFTDLIPEDKKADYYRLADAFAMPGSDPTFDRYPLRFVFLEAMACGLPVVGSLPEEEADGRSQGLLPLIMVDPHSQASIVDGIRSALKQPKAVPVELGQFSFETFTRRVHEIVDNVTKLRSTGRAVSNMAGA
jgi:phosphatidyl-myo-inositol dimannoside synthase